MRACPLNYSLWIAKTIEVDYRMLSCCIRPNAAYWRISLACPVQSQGYVLSIPDVSSHCLLYMDLSRDHVKNIYQTFKFLLF